MFIFTGGPINPQIDALNIPGKKPIRTITSGIVTPEGFLIDATGTIYVMNGTNASFDINEYDAGSTAISRTIAQESGLPGPMRTDADSDLYVMHQDGAPLLRYDRGATTPALVTSSGFCRRPLPRPYLVVDEPGTAYVMEQCGKTGQVPKSRIREYDREGRVLRTIALPETEIPAFIVADAQGRLYEQFFAIANGLVQIDVAEYDPGQTTRSRTFAFGPARTEVGGFYPVVNDATGDLITNWSSCSSRTHCQSYVYVFPTGSTKPSLVIPAPHDTVLAPPSISVEGDLYMEVLSPTTPLRTIREYYRGTRNYREVFSGRNYGLLFLYPNSASASATATAAIAAPSCAADPQLLSGCADAYAATAASTAALTVLPLPVSESKTTPKHV